MVEIWYRARLLRNGSEWKNKGSFLNVRDNYPIHSTLMSIIGKLFMPS